MTYSVGGKIQASDINGFLNNSTPNLNRIWSAGSGTYGYGQTAVPAVSVGDKIKAVTWAALINNINTMASHQGSSGSITPMNPLPIVGNKIKYFAPIASNLSVVDTYRMNTSVQGSSSSTTVTSSVQWSNILTATFTINFASADAIRYFFNAGGQLSITCSHPNTGNINTLLSQICTAMGTLWMSSPTSGTVSLAGTNWNGISQVGSTQPALATVNTNYGYYAWTSTLTQVLQQFVNTYYYHGYGNSTFGQVRVATSGSTVTVELTIDEVPNGAVASSGTSVSLTLRPPSTTYLSNSWGSVSAGTISVSGSISSS